jgi:hypothetical protein
MKKYQIKKGGVTYMFKSHQNLASLKYNPALFFLCNGEFEVNECGVFNAFKQLKSHICNIAKKWVTINV